MLYARKNNPWTPALDEKLKAMWLDGVSTSIMGDVIGLGKNAVIGRAYRIGLPRRHSPINNYQLAMAKKEKRPRKEKPRKPMRILKKTLQPIKLPVIELKKPANYPCRVAGCPHLGLPSRWLCYGHSTVS